MNSVHLFNTSQKATMATISKPAAPVNRRGKPKLSITVGSFGKQQAVALLATIVPEARFYGDSAHGYS